MRPKALWHQIKFPNGEPKKKRKQLQRVSRRRNGQLKDYAIKKFLWLTRPENQECRFPGCVRQTCDVHHSRGRIGKLLLDERYWIAVCRDHHQWIGAHPEEARKLGLLAQKGDWNRAGNIVGAKTL